uniref:Metalloendopeptidase n=1 Tax=Hydractinia echinata TaxID=3283270 RepID=Q2MCX6_HYDEC|nr:astacin 4 [Hydractinia echinata]
MKLVFILLLVARLCASKPNDQSAMTKILKVNGNDKTLFFGDEKLTTEEMRQLIPDQFGVSRKRRGLTKKSANLRWPNNEMPYILSDNFSEDEKTSIRDAIDIIRSVTCIQFTEYPLTSPPQDHVAIFPGSGCWSYVGRIGGAQQISLEHGGCINSGTIIHEVLHALGVHHEQARADRDGYVTINLLNIIIGREINFDKQDTDSLGVEYDPKSVMHYGNDAFSNGNGPTITWKADPTLSLGGNELTEKDIEQMNLFYECNAPTTPTVTTTTTPATTTPEETTSTTTTTTTPATTASSTTTPRTRCRDRSKLCYLVRFQRRRLCRRFGGLCRRSCRLCRRG